MGAVAIARAILLLWVADMTGQMTFTLYFCVYT